MPQTAAVFPSTFISLSLRPFLLVLDARPVIFLALLRCILLPVVFLDHHARHANAVIAGPTVNISIFLMQTLLLIYQYEADFFFFGNVDDAIIFARTQTYLRYFWRETKDF